MSRYRAFISYSHVDTRFATWLHRELEKFRLPDEIVRQQKLPNNRLGTVFRDVSDLGAATRLTTALKEALRDAENLIVVCSPDSAQSPWVALEIAEFRRIHGPEARILSVVSPGAGTSAPEDLFPESLGAETPLAADSRKTADGRRTALLRLVAGMLGTGLDELVRRDTRRRQARILTTAIGSSAIAVAMTVLAFFALAAREDAQRRLSQSEDLIGFMLGDLRDQLTPIGQVRVLESVGEKALEYFETLDDADLTEAALLRKSRALYQVGDVYLQLGNFTSARDSFQVSLEQVRRLWEARPDDDERLFELGQAEYWAGFAAWNAGDLILAEQHLQAYFDAAWMLYERDPNNPDWIMETVWASNNLGSLAFSQSLFSDAKRHFESAIERIDVLIGIDAAPEWLFERSTIYSWLGSTRYHLGEFESAKNAFLSGLARAPDTNDAQDELERAYQLGWLSDIELELGEVQDARAHASEAVSIASALAQADADSMDFLFAHTAHRRRIARLDYHEGNDVDFAPLHEAAKKLLERAEPPPLWRLLAMDVADIGLLSGNTGALDWATDLLEANPVQEGRNTPLQHQYLSLSVSLARIDPAELKRVREVVPIVYRQFEVTKDVQLAASLMRAFDLIGDDENHERFRTIRLEAGSEHPELR